MADDIKRPLALGAHHFPGVWRHMLPEEFQFKRLPSECQSTCDACPKVKEENFHPNIRCCSYHPRVPNFLLGFALEDPATAPLIERVIAEGLTTPEGLQSTPVEMRQSLKQAISPDQPGEDGVVCRFLDAKNRRCGIYHYRDSTCATFFCKHDHKDGADFWESLRAVAGQCEAALSQWAMHEAGIGIDPYIEQFDALAAAMPTLESLPYPGWPPDVLKLLWGDWYGRDAEFYRACAALVRTHAQSLTTILDRWVIRSPRKFEQAFLDSLPAPMRREMWRDGAIPGTNMAISDLQYQFDLAHRNLWQPI